MRLNVKWHLLYVLPYPNHFLNFGWTTYILYIHYTYRCIKKGLNAIIQSVAVEFLVFHETITVNVIKKNYITQCTIVTCNLLHFTYIFYHSEIKSFIQSCLKIVHTFFSNALSICIISYIYLFLNMQCHVCYLQTLQISGTTKGNGMQKLDMATNLCSRNMN